MGIREALGRKIWANMLESKEKALEILERVQAYWAARGYDVQGTIEPRGYSPRLRATVYEVVTDMIGGLPKDFKRAA